MTITDVLERGPATGSPAVRVNDFSINVASPNGSGSQTSNMVIIRALFQMGIPVVGKNLFPSNIQGLPTWYIIRLSKEGYLARKEGTDILAAWNQQTLAQDVAELAPGSVVIYPLDWKQEISRDDLYIYRMPIKELMDTFDIPRELKSRVANMVYVGGVSYLLSIDLDAVEKALSYELHGKEKAVRLNKQVVQAAYDWAKANWSTKIPYRAEPMENSPVKGKFLAEGNAAAGLGAAFGGVSVVAWYPITPSTSLIDATRIFLKRYRHSSDGKPTYAVIQAEDELAALGIVVGAGWAGARAMTSTSGPGISLMAEFAGMGFFAEIPAVIWDVQRVGPSTGLPTRTSQGDVMFTHYLGHGDTKHICLFPASPAECFRFGWESFDIAERFQTPVFVLTDLDLGMNYWTSEDFEYPDKPLDRGKVVPAEDIKKPGDFYRFVDVDGDGITRRTLPGTDSPYAAYFARGTGHNKYGAYSERSDDWEENLQRIFRKIDGSRDKLPQPVVSRMDGAQVGIISYGSNEPAIVEARDMLAAQGISTDYLRLRALPAAHSVHEFIRSFDHVYVVENNLEGQMAQILRLDVPEKADRILSINKQDGLPLTAKFIVSKFLEMEG